VLFRLSFNPTIHPFIGIPNRSTLTKHTYKLEDSEAVSFFTHLYSMSSTHPLKRKPLSYLDVIRCLNELDADFKDSCKTLAQSTVQLIQGFNSISTQLHSVDLQAAMPPVKPQ
jgi:hypothetical protein